MSDFSDRSLLETAQQNTNSFLYKKIIKSGSLLSFRVLVEPAFRVDNIRVNKIEPIDSNWSRPIVKKN